MIPQPDDLPTDYGPDFDTNRIVWSPQSGHDWIFSHVEQRLARWRVVRRIKDPDLREFRRTFVAQNWRDMGSLEWTLDGAQDALWVKLRDEGLTWAEWKARLAAAAEEQAVSAHVTAMAALRLHIEAARGPDMADMMECLLPRATWLRGHRMMDHDGVDAAIGYCESYLARSVREYRTHGRMHTKDAVWGLLPIAGLADYLRRYDLVLDALLARCPAPPPRVVEKGPSEAHQRGADTRQVLAALSPEQASEARAALGLKPAKKPEDKPTAPVARGKTFSRGWANRAAAAGENK